MNTLVNLLDYNFAELGEFFTELGEQKFRAQQVLKWIHQYGITDFACMTNLSKSLREKLQLTAQISLPECVYTQHSKDGTIKWLLK